MTPTQRTIAELKSLGYVVAIVEKWNPFAKIRQDLFGFIDIVAIKENQLGVLGIQATSDSNMSARVHKCEANPILKVWLSGGNQCQVWGWGKKGARGKRKTWELRIIPLHVKEDTSNSALP